MTVFFAPARSALGPSSVAAEKASDDDEAVRSAAAVGVVHGSPMRA